MGKIILNGKEYGGSGGSGGHTIVDSTGTDMPQENKLKFTGAVNVSDDSANGQTVVDVEGGGNYYLNTIYSTEEKKVGYWTDGKPLYQKTVVLNNLSVTNNQWAKTNESATGIETIADGFLIDNQSPSQTFQCDIGVDGGKIAVLTWFVGNSARTMSYLTFRYTKTTDTPESNPQTGGVIYLPTIYSEEEREVGVWRDGKPLYQKSINIGAVTANTVKVIDITSLNVDYVADYIATAVLTNGWKVPLPQTHTSSMSYQAFCRLSSSTQLAVGVGSSVGISDGYVTLQYTKTTDVAGSGAWTPSGANAVHYSTNEQIIGTWIDGKPLYQRTFDIGSTNISYNSWTAVSIPIGDMETITHASAVNQNGKAFWGDVMVSLEVDNTYVALQCGRNGANEIMRYVTLRYTKTTD